MKKNLQHKYLIYKLIKIYNVLAMKKYTLYTDAGSRGNPGKSSYGFLLFEDGFLLDFEGKYLGIKTNNQAEFTAMERGLIMAVQYGIKDLDCFSDSQLLIRQINKEYKIKDLILKEIQARISILSENFDKITFTHVLREKNKFADKMVNLILDANKIL
jgi:ribonuclease HI